MKKRHAISFALASLLLLTCAALGHPGHNHAPDLRLWKDADGLFEIEASFVLAKYDQVQLRKHDGDLIWIPLVKLSGDDRTWVRKRLNEIDRLNSVPEHVREAKSITSPGIVDLLPLIGCSASGGAMYLVLVLVLRRIRRAPAIAVILLATVGSLAVMAAASATVEDKTVPAIQKHFEPFKDKLELKADDKYLYVGSNGLPDHPMMVGIRAWQQQVPLPQPYTGNNAWRIPLKPVLADKPISAKSALFRGAIALAVNGVPIFNALNNRGDDTFLAGELDDYGGHCGRGDDYHYHIAPVHLEKKVGKGNPIAYALDGFPVYGFTDAEGKEPKDLDEFNGRMEKDGYRYYSTKKYPYINGGMRGVVTIRGDQIEPQPRDAPVRPAGEPLRGAKITSFDRDDEHKKYTLKYEVQGKTLSVKYSINNDGTYTFIYTDRNGKETTETYRRRDRKGK